MTSELASKIEKIAIRLDSVGEDHWAHWLKQDVADLKNGNLSGAHHFLSAFGGMGSLNDLYICPENKHKIQPDDVRKINTEISTGLSEAWSIAKSLIKNENHGA